MTTRPPHPRHAVPRALVVAALAAVAACSGGADVVPPPELAGGATELLRSYVALGDGLTAGVQSDGINDSTQRRAYPALLAAAAGTRYAYPAFAMPGCPAPIANAATGARVGGASPDVCALRAPSSAVLNNVAVPGANAADAAGLPGAANPVLATLVLGGRTQVRKAIDASPTFVTLWIGNEDVLPSALAGTAAGVTPLPAFVRSYAAAVDALRAGSPGLRGGVLVGVLDPTTVPVLVSIAALQSDPVLRTTVETRFLGGRRIRFLPNCAPGTTALLDYRLLAILRQQVLSLPSDATIPIACGETTVPGFGTIGAEGVLDPGERAAVAAAVAAYNAYIRAKADSLGFAYLDPNARLASLRAGGEIPVFPGIGDAVRPFGRYFSLDGIRPATAAHLALAQDLVALINGRYDVRIPAPPVVE